MNRVTLGELAEDVYNDYQMNKLKTLDDLKRRFNKHLLPFFGEYRRASTLTTSKINEYIVHRQEQGASNAGINRELAALKRSFSLGVKADPPRLARKPHIKMLKEDNVRQGFFEHQDFESVRNHLPNYLKPFVTFSYITGWRKGEVRNLEWSQVDFKNEWVILEVGTTKNKDARKFPFTDELREVLQQQWEDRESSWVFHLSGKKVGDFRKSWNTACKEVGLAGKIPHDFRRTAVRNLVRAGVPETIAMKMTGHRTRSVFDRYNITSENDLRDAAQLLNAMVTKRLQLPDSAGITIH
jgi:integrase